MSEMGGADGAAVDTGAEGTVETEGQESGAGGEGEVTGGDRAKITKDVINELGESDMDKIVTLKINGKEERVPLREALKISRLEKVSQAKMQEAAQVQRQFAQLMQAAKANPRAFLQKTGIDPYEFAEATLAEKFELMNMTPEQKKLMELERENKDFKSQREREQKEQQERVQTEARTKMQGELEKEIVDAWKDSGLPRHKYFAARISQEMLSSLAQKKAGYREDSLSAKQAADIVKSQVTAELKDILLSVAKTDPGAAQKMLGDDLLKILRDYDVKRVTGQTASGNRQSQQRPDQTSVSGKTSNQVRPMTQKEWDEYFRKL